MMVRRGEGGRRRKGGWLQTNIPLRGLLSKKLLEKLGQ